MVSVARGDQAGDEVAPAWLSLPVWAALRSRRAGTASRNEGVSAIACTLCQGEEGSWREHGVRVERMSRHGAECSMRVKCPHYNIELLEVGTIILNQTDNYKAMPMSIQFHATCIHPCTMIVLMITGGWH